MVEGKLDLTPRYRQKVRFVPLGMGEPVWVDDPHFNIDYHLRHSAVPAPGTETQLRATAARVFSQHLDRSKPLWEIWMVEGLDEDRWALLSKVHHCMVDGVAATDMMSLMFGERPEATNGEVWHPDPEPTGIDLIAYSARHRVRDPAAQVRFALRAPSEVLQSGRRCGARPGGRCSGHAPRHLVADGPHRPTPGLELGEGPAHVRQGGALRARRDGQRRRAHADHQRLPRAAPGPGRADLVRQP